MQTSARMDSKIPYFVHMKNASYGYDYFFCLFQSETVGPMCGTHLASFEEGLIHLEEKHDLKLQPRIDFCKTCECLFNSTVEGLEHYLSHVMDYKNLQVTGENVMDQREKIWLVQFYEKMAQERKNIVNRLLFGLEDNEERVEEEVDIQTV